MAKGRVCKTLIRWFDSTRRLHFLVQREALVLPNLHKFTNLCNISPMGLVETEGRSQATRTAILDAVDRSMAERGFRKTSVDDVAREAGVSRRTVYVHFRDKEDLGLSSIDRVVASVQGSLSATAAGPGSARDRLRSMLIDRVMLRIDSVRGYRQSLDELFEVVRPAYMARRQVYFESEARTLAAVVSAGVERGDFARVHPEAAATSMMLATNAFLPYSLSVEELGARERVLERLSAMVELLMSGLASRPGGIE